jgi:hypothetical protein
VADLLDSGPTENANRIPSGSAGCLIDHGTPAGQIPEQARKETRDHERLPGVTNTMKAPTNRARVSGKTKPKVKNTSGATEPRKSASRSRSQPKAGASAKSASRLIDQRIRDLGGWRGETLARMRALILEADPGMTEEWKWAVPVWSHHGIVCTGEAYKKVVKLTFARGASVPDPARLFNSSLEGNTRRAIDIHEGETVEARAFKTLVIAAVARNGASKVGAKARPGARGARSR